jgi:hypothetical protein
LRPFYRKNQEKKEDDIFQTLKESEEIVNLKWGGRNNAVKIPNRKNLRASSTPVIS